VKWKDPSQDRDCNCANRRNSRNPCSLECAFVHPRLLNLERLIACPSLIISSMPRVIAKPRKMNKSAMPDKRRTITCLSLYSFKFLILNSNVVIRLALRSADNDVIRSERKSHLRESHRRNGSTSSATKSAVMS
jgi:hypothetical protein